MTSGGQQRKGSIKRGEIAYAVSQKITAFTPPYMKWDALSSATSSRLLVGYQIVLFLVPAVIVVGDSVFGLEIREFPISVLFYYIAGLAFFISCVITMLFCPRFCRNGYDYKSFQREGRDSLFFRTEARYTYIALGRNSPVRANHFLRCLLTPPGYVLNLDEEINSGDAQSIFPDIKNPKLKDVIPIDGSEKLLSVQQLYYLMEIPYFNYEMERRIFWEIRWHSASIRKYLRILVIMFLMIGFIFAFLVMFYQFIYVIDKFFGFDFIKYFEVYRD